MYWPAEILDKTAKGYRVQYDNGDKDLVDSDQVSPAEHPTEFGKEEIPLHVGEFVEVHNNSKTDPAAWIGVIKKVQGSSFVVRGISAQLAAFWSKCVTCLRLTPPPPGGE
jgi:hypothetical protein